MYRKISANHLPPTLTTVSESFDTYLLRLHISRQEECSLHKEKHKNRIVYRTLLDITGDCNEKWAHMHGHQYRAITGIYLDDELESICRTQPNFQAASAFNGLGMLFDAARANHVDFFLYLDADAIVTTPKDVVGLMRSSNPDALLVGMSTCSGTSTTACFCGTSVILCHPCS